MNKYNIDFFLPRGVGVFEIGHPIGTLIILVQDKNTSLKLPVGISPLRLVNLHRNRRYFVIKLHTWFLSIIILEDKHKILLHLSIFYEYQQFFQHRICLSI